ncbi:MAG: N-acetylneuraminate synthase [Candidatus Omnitrophota bacterium]
MNKEVFIIAEAGVNHNGSKETAKKMVDAAAKARADAVKFQTFKAEKLVSKNAQKAEYQKRNMPGTGENQLEMLKRLELSFDDFKDLKEYCDEKGIMFLSTPFDRESADFLDELVPIFKISSGEVTNLSFLEYIATKKKPIILSTGMSTLEEIEKAIDVIQRYYTHDSSAEHADLTILHCTTNYPCPYEEANLRAIRTLRDVTGLSVGYSDHTLGIEASLAAISMGARIIEKHFTLDSNMPGPDHKASLEPDELVRLVNGIRNVEKSMGSGEKKPTKSELSIMKVARKSLVAARDLAKGETIREDMFEIKRPGVGIQPSDAAKTIGCELIWDKNKDENLFWEDLK